MNLLDLETLAQRYNTDKQLKDHAYTRMYSQWLKDRKIDSLLEVGLGGGASIRMWLDYLPDAQIYCVEYFGEENGNVWNEFDGNIPGLNLIRGDSAQGETWENVPYGLDVIIDDGDHHPEAQIATFMLGFPKLKSGGIYVVEDCHCGFEKLYGFNGSYNALYGWLFNLVITQQLPNLPSGGDFYKIRNFLPWPSRDILSFHLYKSIIMIEKA